MFIEEHLQELRRNRYAPAAWILYARQLGALVRSEIYANPGAVRSVWSVALGFFAVAFVAAGGMAVAYDRHLAYDFFLRTALWILAAFGFATLYLSLLRNPEGHRLSGLNLPLVLTLLRVSLVPGITLFLVERHFALALGVFLIAALTDVADGWLARRWNQTTRLGTVMDPLVDIVFNLALFGGMAAADLLPDWVFWTAALRYAVLLVGGACLYLFVGPVRIQPTVFGRATGVVMSALVALFMLLHALGGPFATKLIPLTETALGVMLAAAVFQVVTIGWYNVRVMTGAARLPGEIVGDVRWGAR